MDIINKINTLSQERLGLYLRLGDGQGVNQHEWLRLQQINAELHDLWKARARCDALFCCEDGRPSVRTGATRADGRRRRGGSHYKARTLAAVG